MVSVWYLEIQHSIILHTTHMCSVTVMGLWPGFKDALLLSEVSIGVLVSTHYMKILCHKKLKFFIPDFSELLRSQLNFTYQLADLLQKSSVVQLNKFKPTENKPWRKDNSASFLFYWFLKTDPTINIFQLQTCSTANLLLCQHYYYFPIAASNSI